jgi:hypothetical protein
MPVQEQVISRISRRFSNMARATPLDGSARVKKSRIFHTDRFREIQQKTKDFLNGYPDFLSASTARSTRAFGDAVEGILGEHFQEIVGDDCAEYSATFARRSMADIAFKDKDDLYYVIDVKTHREDTKFNMPNLTSVERLARFYEEDSNYFALLLVKYTIEGTHATISDVLFAPIELGVTLRARPLKA